MSTIILDPKEPLWRTALVLYSRKGEWPPFIRSMCKGDFTRLPERLVKEAEAAFEQHQKENAHAKAG